MLEKHFEFVRKTLFDNKVPFHDEKKKMRDVSYQYFFFEI